MSTITVVTGALLIVLGLVGFIGTGSTHYTSLIPAYFGVVLGFCGFMARAPERRKLYMHIAVTLGLLGFLSTVMGIVAVVRMAAGETFAATAAAAGEAKAVMAFICGIYVALCVNSFIKARKATQSTK